jgi:hypothetical protein
MILKSIKAAESERSGLQKRLKAAATDTEKKEAQDEVERITQRLAELNTSFEELATGGMSVAALEKETEQKPAD